MTTYDERLKRATSPTSGTTKFGQRVQGAGRTTPTVISDEHDPVRPVGTRYEGIPKIVEGTAKGELRHDRGEEEEMGPVSIQSFDQLQAYRQIMNNPNLDPRKKEAIAAGVGAYLKENPNIYAQQAEAARVAEQKAQAEAFADKYIQQDAWPSSRLAKEQRRIGRINANLMMDGGAEIKAPQRYEDLRPADPDSKAGKTREAEQRGLDTTTGWGTFTDVARKAMTLSNTNMGAALMEATIRDDLAENGWELPPGVNAIRTNQDLGALEYLRPTGHKDEGGALRWTLAEAENFRWADLGAVADLEETLAMVGSVLALPASAGNPAVGPFAREFLGDFAGRNVGKLLEALWNYDIVTEQDMIDTFGKAATASSAGQSLMAAGISRSMARLAQWWGNKGTMRLEGGRSGETAESLAARQNEAADLVEEVNRLAEPGSRMADGREVQGYTLEAGSWSDKAARQAESRTRYQSAAYSNEIEVVREERVRTLGHINEKIAKGPDADAHREFEDLQGALEAHYKLRSAEIKRTEELNEAIGTINVEQLPNGVRRMSFFGEVDATDVPAGAGSYGGNHGMLYTQDEYGHVFISDIFTGENFKGGVAAQFISELLEDGSVRSISFGDSMSKDSQAVVNAAEKMGFSFWRNPTAKLQPDGKLYSTDGKPLYVLTAVEGQRPISWQSRLYDYTNAADAEKDLGARVTGLPVLEAEAKKADALLDQQIGWSNQTQQSAWKVENKRTSGLSTTIRRVQNRIARALDTPGASQADRYLAAMSRKEVDEEGYEFLGGLAGESLDLGQLLRSRERLVQMANETQDPDLLRAVKDIDNLIQNAPMSSNRLGPMEPKRRMAILEGIERQRTTAKALSDEEQFINANIMFARDEAGEFINLSYNNISKIMANEAKFIRHMSPLLDGSPALRASAVDALHVAYTKEVLNTPGGWTVAKQDRFNAKYGRAINTIYKQDPRARNELMARVPGNGTTGRFEAHVARAQRRTAEAAEILRTDPGTPPINLSNPANILKDMNKAGPGRSKAFLSHLDATDPALASSIRREYQEQVRAQLHKTFFDLDRGTQKLAPGDKLLDWYKTNRDMLVAVGGPQYASDMGTMARAHAMDASRTRVNAKAPEAQADIIRVTRSFLGPLSSIQRKITAGNYVNHKVQAATVLKIFSDPEMIRTLTLAKNIDAKTAQGIAVLTRLGIPQSQGIVGDPRDPEYQARVRQMVDESIRASKEVWDVASDMGDEE